MSEDRQFILCDQASGTYLEKFRIDSSDFGGGEPWAIHKRRMRGGPADGVERIDIDTAGLKLTVLPTRGMGIWRAEYRGIRLGWDAPVVGPVHPGLVNLESRGGLGWLDGFDEWIVRCGLFSNGAPGPDTSVDANGQERTVFLPLHGRIANQPAHYLEIRIDEGAKTITVLGKVSEGGLFLPGLTLETKLVIQPGIPRLILEDTISTPRSGPTEMQLLYHCNFGPPLLGPGARLLAPMAEMAPRDAVSAEFVSNYDCFPPPTAGVVEQAYYFDLSTNAGGQTMVALIAPDGKRGCAMRYPKEALPCFTFWRNPGAIEDGYVAGLEPATNFPNAKQFERAHGRVPSVEPGRPYQASLELEFADTKTTVERWRREIEEMQSGQTPVIHTKPRSGWSKG